MLEGLFASEWKDTLAPTAPVCSCAFFQTAWLSVSWRMSAVTRVCGLRAAKVAGYRFRTKHEVLLWRAVGWVTGWLGCGGGAQGAERLLDGQSGFAWGRKEMRAFTSPTYCRQ